MKVLSNEAIHQVSAASIDNCSYVHGYNYLTPTGEIKFNGIYIVTSDKRTFGLGLIPEGWFRISDQEIIQPFCIE